MATTNDIILTVDSELIEDNGDFKTGENDNNLIYYNVVSHPGHWRTSPLLGAGIDKYLNGNVISSAVERDIKSKLASDIFRTATVDASGFPEIVINKELVITVNGND